MNIVGIIPARYGSTRFPGKPLIEIAGKTMIQRVVERARLSGVLSSVIVATDDERIYNHIQSLGEKAIMTSPHHQSGTDRCLEALVLSGENADAVINIQGDEPFVDPSQLKLLVDLISKREVEIATLVIRIKDDETLFDPNKVKVVFDEHQRAIYFSRHAIPFLKGVEKENWMNEGKYFKHLGLYAYKVGTLSEICKLAPSPLEISESLEQLRWLEDGRSIYVAETMVETPAIDTPSDLEKILLSGRQF